MDGWVREGHQASTLKQKMHTEELLIGCVIQSIRISSFFYQLHNFFKLAYQFLGKMLSFVFNKYLSVQLLRNLTLIFSHRQRALPKILPFNSKLRIKLGWFRVYERLTTPSFWLPQKKNQFVYVDNRNLNLVLPIFILKMRVLRMSRASRKIPASKSREKIHVVDVVL